MRDALPTIVVVLSRPQQHALRRLEKLFRVVTIGRPDASLVDAAVRDGLVVMGDWYPYTYWHSSIYVLIPDRDFENRAKWQAGLDDVGQFS